MTISHPSAAQAPAMPLERSAGMQMQAQPTGGSSTMNHRIDIDIGAASIQRACLLMAGLAVAWVAPGNANRRSDPKGSVHMSRPTPSRSHNARTAGRALSALALSLGLCGNAQAQSQPAVDVEVMRTPALMQPKGPADGGQVSFQCVNQGTAIATRVSCAAVMQMRDNDGSIVEVMPNDMRCTQGATQSAVVAPFTLQPNGSDGDTVWCDASAPYGGQLGARTFLTPRAAF